MGRRNGRRLRFYEFTDLPPSLPLCRRDPETRTPESNHRRLGPPRTVLRLDHASRRFRSPSAPIRIAIPEGPQEAPGYNSTPAASARADCTRRHDRNDPSATADRREQWLVATAQPGCSKTADLPMMISTKLVYSRPQRPTCQLCGRLS